jgi:hypothetical protein
LQAQSQLPPAGVSDAQAAAAPASRPSAASAGAVEKSASAAAVDKGRAITLKVVINEDSTLKFKVFKVVVPAMRRAGRTDKPNAHRSSRYPLC